MNDEEDYSIGDFNPPDMGEITETRLQAGAKSVQAFLAETGKRNPTPPSTGSPINKAPPPKGSLRFRSVNAMISIVRDGKEIGEWTQGDVERQFCEGSILPTDYYWTNGMSQWESIASVICPPLPPAAEFINNSRTMATMPSSQGVSETTAPLRQAGSDEKPIGRDIELEAGYWISDRGDHLYIPYHGKNSPYAALGYYYNHIAYGDKYVSDWVGRILPQYRNKPNSDPWEFWELFCTFLILHKWHLVWCGFVYSRLSAEATAQIICRLNGVKEDLAWPEDARILFRQVQDDDDVEGEPYTWDYFINARPMPKTLGAEFELPPEYLR